jgi:hypothetical protein
MMLCGVSVVFNSLGDVLGLMSCKRSSENGQVLVGFQSTNASILMTGNRLLKGRALCGGEKSFYAVTV